MSGGIPEALRSAPPPGGSGTCPLDCQDASCRPPPVLSLVSEPSPDSCPPPAPEELCINGQLWIHAQVDPQRTDGQQIA